MKAGSVKENSGTSLDVLPRDIPHLHRRTPETCQGSVSYRSITFAHATGRPSHGHGVSNLSVTAFGAHDHHCKATNPSATLMLDRTSHLLHKRVDKL
jgi:hypothetical protein